MKTLKNLNNFRDLSVQKYCKLQEIFVIVGEGNLLSEGTV